MEVRLGIGIAFHVFALSQAELRARTLQKRRHAKRSAAAVACAVLSALGRWSRTDTGLVGARTGRLKRLPYNDAQNVTVTWLEQA